MAPTANGPAEVFQVDARAPPGASPGAGAGAGVSPGAGASSHHAGGVLRYYFHVGSVDSFERKLDEAQRELGIRPQDMVPVK